MARQVFLRNLQQSAWFLSPRFHVNGIRLGPAELRTALQRRGIAPTTQAVDGFDPNDFPDLDPRARAQLERDVAAFRTHATPAVEQPTPSADADERALDAFIAILTAMQPYLEGFEVYAALKRQSFPAFVEDFAVTVGPDSTAYPSAWIWVIVDDRETAKQLSPRVREVKERVEEALEDANINLYPYVLFRTHSEQIDMEGALQR